VRDRALVLKLRNDFRGGTVPHFNQAVPTARDDQLRLASKGDARNLLLVRLYALVIARVRIERRLRRVWTPILDLTTRMSCDERAVGLGPHARDLSSWRTYGEIAISKEAPRRTQFWVHVNGRPTNTSSPCL